MKLFEDLYAFSDGKINKAIGVLITNPCFHSVLLYRLSSFFYKKKLKILAKIVWYINRIVFSVDIDYRAKLSGGLVLIHGIGTVIGKDVISKGRLYVYQGVTIGGSGFSKVLDGNEIWQPIIEDGVRIYTNALVLGPIHIGKNETIKAGERVTRDR
ncbi:MAG: hypothetical protein K6B64_01265 [Acholeplasmatales bacterium]|nr:hypothetical protein [Acholeplasmatales bacterium]